MSRPVGESDLEGLLSMTLCSVDDAIRFLTKAAKGALMVKLDVRDNFRLFVPVQPDDLHLCGFKVEDKLCFEVVLPFGCRSSLLFCIASDSLLWVAKTIVRDTVPGLSTGPLTWSVYGHRRSTVSFCNPSFFPIKSKVSSASLKNCAVHISNF